MRTISATTGLSTQTVLRAISTLVSDDVIFRNGTPNRGTGVYYRRS